MIWIQFLISAGIILAAGTQLTKQADRLSDALGLGKVWIGVVLLGLVTSLPEAGSSLYAAAVLSADDLAVGNMVGSNNFNLLLIVFLDLVYRKGAVTNLVTYHKAHFLSAAFALALAGTAALEIGLSRVMPLPEIFGVSVGSVTIACLYFLGMRKIYVSNPGQGPAAEDRQSLPSLRIIYLGLALSAAGVVIGAVLLAHSADILAQETGLGGTFVGSLFLAAATSLPELVVTVSALKMGQVDLAVGNIFGSNMVNMFLLAVCDPFARGRALLQQVSTAHVVTIAAGFLMTWIVVQGLKQNTKRKFLNIGWDSWMILAVYVLGIVVLYGIR